MSAPARVRRRDERGDAIVVFCVAMILVILPLGGISLDLWHAISDERALQSAADAAAAAGADAVNTTAYRADPSAPILDPAQATDNALASLRGQSGLPSLSQTPTIIATPQGITVVLREHVQLTLLRLVAGNRTIDITATSASAPRASGHP
jgi:Flp pilus assembly protein TadG